MEQKFWLSPGISWGGGGGGGGVKLLWGKPFSRSTKPEFDTKVVLLSLFECL